MIQRASGSRTKTPLDSYQQVASTIGAGRRAQSEAVKIRARSRRKTREWKVWRCENQKEVLKEDKRRARGCKEKGGEEEEDGKGAATRGRNGAGPGEAMGDWQREGMGVRYEERIHQQDGGDAKRKRRTVNDADGRDFMIASSLANPVGFIIHRPTCETNGLGQPGRNFIAAAPSSSGRVLRPRLCKLFIMSHSLALQPPLRLLHAKSVAKTLGLMRRPLLSLHTSSSITTSFSSVHISNEPGWFSNPLPVCIGSNDVARAGRRGYPGFRAVWRSRPPTRKRGKDARIGSATAVLQHAPLDETFLTCGSHTRIIPLLLLIFSSVDFYVLFCLT